jgi:hypothetical protein
MSGIVGLAIVVGIGAIIVALYFVEDMRGLNLSPRTWRRRSR